MNANEIANGVLSALVSITAGCAFVDYWGAVFIGCEDSIFVKLDISHSSHNLIILSFVNMSATNVDQLFCLFLYKSLLGFYSIISIDNSSFYILLNSHKESFCLFSVRLFP